MGLLKHFIEFIDMQYQKPTGLFGMYLGEKMTRQHQPETLWTIEQLNLQHDENLLELGCGAGYAIKILLEQPIVNQVVGLDLSQTVLQTAKLRNRAEINKGRAQLIQGNVNHLPFKDESFTKVFSIHSVYFWDDLPKTTSEIYRVLKPGGSLIITLCNGKNGDVWSDIQRKLEQQLIPAMEQCGFENIEIKEGPSSRQFNTVAVTGRK